MPPKKVKTLKKFFVWWYRASTGSEPPGPMPETTIIESPSLKRAKEWAKSLAKERGWRVMEVSLEKKKGETDDEGR